MSGSYNVGTERVQINTTAQTVRNDGPSTVYWGGPDVSSTVNTGSIASGSSTAFDGDATFVSAAHSYLAVMDTPESAASIPNNSITNAKINSAAAIAQSKVALSITASEIAAALKPSGTAAAGTEALRALGTTASTAAAGNDARLGSVSDGAITAAKVSDTLKPSVSAAAGTEALRALGATASTAAAGNDTRFPAGADIVNADVDAGAAIAESKLNLASDAAAGTASRRTLGTSATSAAAGNDSRLTDARPSASVLLIEMGGQFSSAQTVATYIFADQGGGIAPGANLNHLSMSAFPIYAADYPSVAGKTFKPFVRVELATNATAAGASVTYTVGLYPVSSSQGTSSANDLTLGTVVSGSTVLFSNPAASSKLSGTSGDFTLPSDGQYVLGYAIGGATVAVGTRILAHARVLGHYV